MQYGGNKKQINLIEYKMRNNIEEIILLNAKNQKLKNLNKRTKRKIK